MTGTGERVRALAELVRLPAVLTVPGDALAGAALAGGTMPAGRAAGIAGASAALYLGGMALNDVADRDVDARERPERPIPSGRVSVPLATGVATGLTGLGLALAGWAGGRRALTTATATAAAAWTYDLATKSTPAGPWTMAAARALDVLLGAAAAVPPERPAAQPWAPRAHHVLRGAGSAGSGQRAGRVLHVLPGVGTARPWRPGRTAPPVDAAAPGGAQMVGALSAAAVVGLHTAVVTRLSAHEVEGSAAGVAQEALVGTAGVVAAAALLAARRAPDPVALGGALGLLGAYAVAVGGPQAAARDRTDGPTVRRAVGAGVLGLVLLEAALLAAAGRKAAAVLVAGLWPLARTLARRRSVT